MKKIASVLAPLCGTLIRPVGLQALLPSPHLVNVKVVTTNSDPRRYHQNIAGDKIELPVSFLSAKDPHEYEPLQKMSKTSQADLIF